MELQGEGEEWRCNESAKSRHGGATNRRDTDMKGKEAIRI